MDEFGRLRHKIYLERSGDPAEDHRQAVQHLGTALFTGPDVEESIQNTLDAAALRRAENPDPVFDLLPLAGTSPFFDRYLADAIASHPGIHQEASEFLTQLAGRDQSPERFTRLETMLDAAVDWEGKQPADQQRALTHTDDALPVAHPVSVVQCMFYGDPSRSGRGTSGGIGTLLNELGTAMAKEAGGVVTLVLYDSLRSTYPLVRVEQVSENHSIVRVPVALENEPPFGFLEGRHQIQEAVYDGFVRHALRPEVVHVRFLDDASLAAVRAATLAGARVVATITPDPHRQVCDPDGSLRSLETPVALEYFNKILIGDEIVGCAQGLVAIGKETIQRELWPYYPQLEDTRGRVAAGIDEGVRTSVEDVGLDIETMLTVDPPTHRLTRENLGRPTILSVGRLAPVKNQPALVKSWARKAWRTHNLVLVGGDLENPSDEEASIIEAINEAVRDRPSLRGRFCHLAGSPNPVIRALQAHYAAREYENGPDVYVCPSLKEEFGLSILEAMASGMVVFAPLRGGAGTYINHGVNGFLVDTRDEQVLAAELANTLLSPALSKMKARSISRNAMQTVRSRYSVERIAHEFSAYYEKVKNA